MRTHLKNIFLATNVIPVNQELNPFMPLVEDIGNSLLGEAMRSGDLTSFIQTAFTIAIVLGGMLAVARIAYGGFMYMTKDAFQTKTDAKKIILDAVVGLVVLVSIVLILRQINPQLTNLDITATKVETPGAGGGTAASPNSGGQWCRGYTSTSCFDSKTSCEADRSWYFSASCTQR